MLVFPAADVAAVGVVGFDQPSLTFRRAVIDSREARSGDLFVCLQGESTDGHLYAGSAVKNGASALLIDQSRLAQVKELVQEHLQENLEGGVAILCTADVLATLQGLADLRRQRYTGTVFAVVGSNGKTSTKEILASLLRCQLGDEAVFATPGNWNNHLGLPLSLLSLPDTAAAAVLELGMNHAGEIAHLSKIARPHHCVVPSIGFEHMEFFASIDEVAAAELEVLQGMQGGFLVYPEAAPEHDLLYRETQHKGVQPILFRLVNEATVGPETSGVATDDRASRDAQQGDLAALVCRAVYEGNAFRLGEDVFFSGEYAGEAMTSNILACVLLLQHVGFGKGLDRCTAALQPTARGRFRSQRIRSTLIVDDTYNANPDSFRQSIRTMRELLPSGRLLCLAGHLAELGHFSAAGHRQVGEDLALSGFDELIVCGQEDVKGMLTAFRKGDADLGKYFVDSSELSTYLKEHPEQIGRFDGILVKGSRSARMERVLPVLQELLERG